MEGSEFGIFFQLRKRRKRKKQEKFNDTGLQHSTVTVPVRTAIELLNTLVGYLHPLGKILCIPPWPAGRAPPHTRKSFSSMIPHTEPQLRNTREPLCHRNLRQKGAPFHHGWLFAEHSSNCTRTVLYLLMRF
ncbi:hypothetical protein HOY82DRAFT_548976 [Tuber indicum]|nr:hypothetical protein HOY82DRAFT_548976 [Tuber indicum]